MGDTAAGTVQDGTQQAGTGQGGGGGNGAGAGDWRTFLTPELKSDPIVAGWSEKASEKDIPSLIKGYAHTFTKLGNAINLPGKDAKPEDVAALRSRLYQAGVFVAPPADAKGYDLKRPEKLPDGFGWSEELSGKFANVFFKHGIPKAAVDELLPIYQEGLLGAQRTLKTSMDAGEAALKREFGDKYDELHEAASRMVSGIFKTPEELAFFNELGLGNHPAFMGPLMRLAPLALQDSSFMAGVVREGGQISGDDAKSELSKIMNDPQHPDYEGYRRGDPKTQAKVDELYRKAYGTKPVDLSTSGGVTITTKE